MGGLIENYPQSRGPDSVFDVFFVSVLRCLASFSVIAVWLANEALVTENCGDLRLQS